MANTDLEVAVENAERMARELREWINRNVAPPANADGIVLVDRLLDCVDDVRYESHQEGHAAGYIHAVDINAPGIGERQ